MSATLEQPELDTILTPEELEAIHGDDMSEAERAAMARIAGEADADAEDADDQGNLDDEAEPDGDEEPQREASSVPTPAEEPPAAVEPAAEEGFVPEPSPRSVATPSYEARLPEDYDDKVKDLETQESDLKAQFKAGDIEFDEFEGRRAAIVAQRDDLRVAKVKAEISQEMAEQSTAAQWQRAIDDLAQRAIAPEGGGIDYRKDAEKAADLDAFVRTLANNPAHAERSMEWFLSEAHRRVCALHGVELPKTPPKEGKAADPVREAASRRKPPLEAVPASIAGVPGGDGPGDVGSEFADLDALEGDALEAALARMTPEQRQKYAMGV